MKTKFNKTVYEKSFASMDETDISAAVRRFGRYKSTIEVKPNE